MDSCAYCRTCMDSNNVLPNSHEDYWRFLLIINRSVYIGLYFVKIWFLITFCGGPFLQWHGATSLVHSSLFKFGTDSRGCDVNEQNYAQEIRLPTMCRTFVTELSMDSSFRSSTLHTCYGDFSKEPTPSLWQVLILLCYLGFTSVSSPSGLVNHFPHQM
jgi:hypothetical protein